MKYPLVGLNFLVAGRLIKVYATQLDSPEGILRFLAGIAILIISTFLLFKRKDEE